MIETIYLLSANSRVDFKWYLSENGKTNLVQGQEPECWTILNGAVNRLYTSYTGFALVIDTEKRLNAIFTGLLAEERMSGAGKIQDTIVLTSPNSLLTDRQKLLISAFLRNIGKVAPSDKEEFYDFSCLSPLSKAIDDNMEQGVSLNLEHFNTEIQSLLSQIEELYRQSQQKLIEKDVGLKEGIYQSTRQNREALAQVLLEEPLSFKEKPDKSVVAIVTQSVRAKNLGGDVIWGLTDDPLALP